MLAVEGSEGAPSGRSARARRPLRSLTTFRRGATCLESSPGGANPNIESTRLHVASISPPGAPPHRPVAVLTMCGAGPAGLLSFKGARKKTGARSAPNHRGQDVRGRHARLVIGKRTIGRCTNTFRRSTGGEKHRRRGGTGDDIQACELR